ncbi:MAG: hypothetical protein RIM80_21650, partial [Alphaproteobacteria bacterium]
TDTGRNFRLRRTGFFTRIQQGKGASAPQPAPAGTVGQSMAKLEGRNDADGGAQEKPTDQSAGDRLGAPPPPQSEPPPQQGPGKPNPNAPPPNDQNAGGPPLGPEGPGDLQQLPQDQDPTGNDGGDGGEAVVKNGFAATLLELSAARRANASFDTIAERVEVVDLNDSAASDAPATSTVVTALDPNAFDLGDRFFRVTDAAGQSELIAPLEGGPLAFFEPGVNDPDDVRNIFDANDAATYVSPETYNAQILDAAGVDAQILLEAQNIATDLFFNYDLTSPDFDGVNGSRLTLVGGVPLVQRPTGFSFFDPNDDKQTISALPYGEIGRAQLAPGGGLAGIARFEAASVNQTPVIVDWARGKALYVGSVMQNVQGVAQGQADGTVAYAIQAFVGDVVSDGASAIKLVGFNAGSTHYEEGAGGVRQFHGGDVAGAFLGDPSLMALSMDGGHATLEHLDGDGVRQDPTFVANHQFGVEIDPIAIDPAGSGVTNEQLFVGNIAADSDGSFVVLATDPDSSFGVGQLTIDRNAGELTADIRFADSTIDGDAFTTNKANSAFVSDTLFAIADPGGFESGDGPGFVFVSGAAVMPASVDVCACEFVHWGLWAGGQNNPQEFANTISDVGMFFAGAPTVDMPVTGSATYAGHAAASMIRPGDVEPQFATGAFTLNTQFATGVSAGQMNLGPEDFTVIGQHTPGQAALNVQYVQGAQIVGGGSGGFYGPNAANVAVTIAIDNGQGLQAGGGAVAERQ